MSDYFHFSNSNSFSFILFLICFYADDREYFDTARCWYAVVDSTEVCRVSNHHDSRYCYHCLLLRFLFFVCFPLAQRATVWLTLCVYQLNEAMFSSLWTFSFHKRLASIWKHESTLHSKSDEKQNRLHKYFILFMVFKIPVRFREYWTVELKLFT